MQKEVVMHLPVPMESPSGYGILCKLDKSLFPDHSISLIEDSKPSKLWQLFNIISFNPPLSQNYSFTPDVKNAAQYYIGDTHIANQYLRKYDVRSFQIRLHNVYHAISLTWKDALRDPRFFIVWLIYMKAENRFFRLIRSSNNYHTLWVLSERDRVSVLKYIGRNVTVLVENHIRVNASRKSLANPILTSKRLVWIGGISSHKKYSVIHFLKTFENAGNFQIHLFGKGTLELSEKMQKEHIHFHGFLEGNQLPFNGDAIFVNPDMYGLGVKYKLVNLIEKDVWILTTQEGITGYEHVNYPKFIIAPVDKWPTLLKELHITNAPNPPVS